MREITIDFVEKDCACGCGRTFMLNPYYKTVRYIFGHHTKGNPHNWLRKDKVQWRRSHEIANKIVGRWECAVNNDSCKGPLEVAHLDGNEFNNNPRNLKCLCMSHHKLLDNRNLSFEDLVSNPPTYYTDGRGKRRYRK